MYEEKPTNFSNPLNFSFTLGKNDEIPNCAVNEKLVQKDGEVICICAIGFYGPNCAYRKLIL